MRPALPPETGILPSVASNPQPSSPFYPTDGPCGRPQPRPATSPHPSPLQPFCTAHLHLRAVCPAARIHHQTIIYCSQLAQNRILHFNTRPEYLPASPIHADPPVAPYDSCPVHISQLQPRPITHPGFIRRRQAQEFRAAGLCILVEAKDCPQFTPWASQAAANHPAKAGSVRDRKVGLRRANALHALLQAPPGVYEEHARNSGVRRQQAHGYWGQQKSGQPPSGPCMAKMRLQIQGIEPRGSKRVYMPQGQQPK